MAILVPEVFTRDNAYIAWAERLRGAVALHIDAAGILKQRARVSGSCLMLLTEIGVCE